MRRWFALALVCLLACASVRAQSASQPLDLQQATHWADQVVGEAIRRDAFPGAVVVFVRADGAVAMRGYGTGNLRSHSRADPKRTLLQIGSITKLFTAIVALQLMEEHKLALDGDVAQYLRGFHLRRPELGSITVWDLLTHRAGFDSSLIGDILANPADVAQNSRQLRRWLIRVRPAGILTSYDNFAVSLLGRIEEDVTGRSYASLIRERIFVPLGMRDSIMQYDPRYEDRVAGCAVPDGAGHWQYCPWLYAPQYDAPAGGIYTSGADLGRFMRMLLNRGAYPGGRLISERSFAEFTDFDQNRLTPGIPGIGLLTLQNAPVERGDWGHDGGGYGSVNTLYVAQRAGFAGFLGVTGGEKDIPLTVTGLLDFAFAGTRSEQQFDEAYELLRTFDHEIAALTPLSGAALKPPQYTDRPFTAEQVRSLAGDYYSIRRASFAPLLGRMIVPLMSPWTHITAGSAGTLSIGGRPYRQVAPRIFAGPDGDRIGFRADHGVVTAGALTISQLQREAWWQLPRFAVIPLVVSLLVCICATPLLRRTRIAPPARAALMLGGLAAVSLIVCLLMEFQFGPTLYVTDREWIALSFRLPMQASVLALAAAPLWYVWSVRLCPASTRMSALAGAALAGAAAIAAAYAMAWGLLGHLSGV